MGFWDSIKELFGGAASDTQEHVETMQNAAGSTAEDLQQKAQDMTQNAGEQAGQAAEQVGQKVEETKDKFTGQQ